MKCPENSITAPVTKQDLEYVYFLFQYIGKFFNILHLHSFQVFSDRIELLINFVQIIQNLPLLSLYSMIVLTYL